MYTLVIGQKNLSSWSLRPWLLLRRLRLPFREVSLLLDTPQFQAQIRQYSKALRVPVLIDGDLHVWDSLAILEYLNEKVGGQAWPQDAALRAQARSISAEMHSGFPALRQTWSMRALGRNHDVPLTPEAAADVARVQAIWTEARSRHAERGPWLFGEYSIADAMYAPVVLRFNHYGAQLNETARAYAAHWLADEHLQAWIEGARSEEAASRQ
jgi:glutathione S-transferase